MRRHALASGVALGALALLACGRVAIEPPDLVGVWRTDTPTHRDRRLEIQPDWIVFGTGGEASSSYPRDGIEVEPASGGGLLCSLYYRDAEGARTQVRLVYQPGPPETLRFQNRAELWVREADPRRARERG